MGDPVDESQPTEELFLNLAIRAARGIPTVRDSASNCEECGVEISSARQLAVPGCLLCTECGERLESLRARGLTRR